MQTTLARSAEFRGTGLHTGRPVRLTVRPAPRDHGVVFVRRDLPANRRRFPARWDLVEQTPLCTRLRNAQGETLSTIEHLMAALAGLGIHNALVELDGPELPILDGSSAPFLRKLAAAGRKTVAAPLPVLRVLREVEVRRGEATARLEPFEGAVVEFEIAFADSAIGRQRRRIDLAGNAFQRELADSRTFCRHADVAAMQSAGLALGGTLENAVVVDGAEVLTPGGLRHRDEPVRHKMLDAVGDLALAGAPILGRYVGRYAGHALTNALLRELFASPDAYEVVPATQAMLRALPGDAASREGLALIA